MSIARRTRSNLGGEDLGEDEEEVGEYGDEDLNLELDEGEEDDASEEEMAEENVFWIC